MQDVAAVRREFVDPEGFWSSPLYLALSATIARTPYLIELAAQTRSGQVPSFAFFGAVHALVLDGVDDPLAEYFVSVRGAHARPVEAGAGPALESFARKHADQLRVILRTRLVQTNHVQRAVGLRLALTVISSSIGDEPAHLLEIGSSAGLVLRQAAYGYRLGDRRSGDQLSPVQLTCEWRNRDAVPDLDAVPAIASTTGIDLNPLDPRDADDRRWLRALVWPEDTGKAAQLAAALDLAVRVPVTVHAGDATQLCPQWSAGLPPGEPRVVFHCATRMHVPLEDRPAFDAAIEGVGADGPLYRITIEGDGLVITGPDRSIIATYDVDGHLAWVKPRDASAAARPG